MLLKLLLIVAIPPQQSFCLFLKRRSLLRKEIPKNKMISPLQMSDKEEVNCKSLSAMKEHNSIDEDVSERLNTIKAFLDKNRITGVDPEDLLRFSSLSYAIRITLQPVDLLMKVCGLTYGSSCPMKKQFLIRHKIQRIYTILVAILVFCSAVRFIPALFRETKSAQFIKYEYFLWNSKCAIQAIYCIFICSRYGRKISRFQSLIAEYDEQLSRFKDTLDKKGQRNYHKVARFITVVLFCVVLLALTLTGCNVFLPSFSEVDLQELLFEPFKNRSLALKFLLFLSSFYLVVAWLLPVILYCYFCLTFCLVLDQFKAYIASRQSSKVDDYIDYVREEYRRVKELVEQTDNVIGFMALCVYCFDVILCCFHLFHFFYHAKTTVEKITPAYNAAICLANLIFMSVCASRVSEKV